eukprot:5937932-Pyramimonas_sp.AAC.1
MAAAKHRRTRTPRPPKAQCRQAEAQGHHRADREAGHGEQQEYRRPRGCVREVPDRSRPPVRGRRAGGGQALRLGEQGAQEEGRLGPG